MMNLLPYDNDGTFGDVGPSSAGRWVDIVGTMGKGTWGDGLLSLVNLADNYIKPEFVRRGWSIGNVDLRWKDGRYHFRIAAWVLNQHSNDEIVVGAKAALLGVRQGALGLQTFSDVHVGLQLPNSTVGANTGGIPTGGNSSGVSADLGSFFDSIGSGLGTGLGISTPVVLLVGAGVLILILRR